MGVTFGGLASGLDTNAIVTGLMAVERQPLDSIHSTQSQVDSAKATISSFSSKLSALQTAAKALQDPAGYGSYTATSSDAAVVASASGSASAGAYAINVTQLAKEQRTYSNTQSSDTAALGLAGTLSLTIGTGSPISITVGATDSLGSIASAINSSGARATAAIVYDGTDYRLQVRGLDTGASNAITFGESGFSLGLGTPANTYQNAQDAKLTVDGLAITRSTNQITGVIAGVTLGLSKLTSSPATVSVAADPSALNSKLNAFVSAYNDIVNTSHTLSGYGTQKASNPLLASNFTLRNTVNQLQSIVGNVVAGTTGKYTTLGSVGLSSTRDGLLQFDSTKLATAMSEDSGSVSKLFVTDKATGATGVMARFTSTITSFTTGTDSPIGTLLDAFDRRAKQLTTDEAAMSARLTTYEAQLRSRFTALEGTISTIKAQGDALGSLSTTTYK